MNAKILCVDDDANLLDGYKRNLRSEFNIETALSAREGIELIINKGPFALVISDMRMPEIDGIEFLSMVKNKSPDSVRIMLTGNADMDTAINAVNEGNIFRFLTKPCSPDMLKKSINAGIEQYRLIISEKEILEKTLKGIIKILAEILSLTNPLAFSRASRVIRLVRQIAAKINIKQMWQLEIAAMLSQIGCIAVPEETLRKAYKGLALSLKEKEMFETYPKVGADLLSNIPRMEKIAKIIAYQEKYFDGSGIPDDTKKNNDIPIGSRILKLALDFDTLIFSGMSTDMALPKIKNRKGWYDPAIVETLENIITNQKKQKMFLVKIDDLKPNMILAEDVIAKNGAILLSKGQEVSPYMKIRLINYEKSTGVRQPIKVFISAEM